MGRVRRGREEPKESGGVTETRMWSGGEPWCGEHIETYCVDQPVQDKPILVNICAGHVCLEVVVLVDDGKGRSDTFRFLPRYHRVDVTGPFIPWAIGQEPQVWLQV